MHLPIKQSIFTLVSLVLMSAGVVLAIFWKDIYTNMMAKFLALAPGADTYKIWSAPPFDVFFDVYLFNWTNPSDLKKKNYQKPLFQELGPYRFRETHTKTRVKWHTENNTVSYKRKSVYHFDEEGSKGRLDDKIVTINAFAASVAYAAKDWNFLVKKLASGVLSTYKHKTFIEKEARELLFDGYHDDLISLTHRASKILPFKLKLPYDRFGWLYGRNESEDLTGHYNIYTGQDDISKLGITKTWNYNNATPYYPSPCNDVHGSGGEFYPPGQRKDRPVSIFNGELCRYLDLYFDKEESFNGVDVLKFAGNEHTVDNGSRYSENICFSNGNRYPSGVMDISECRYGAPVMISFPHFYAADPYYLQLVDGLSPNKDIHEMYVKMEPDTGLPVELTGRLQVNVLVQPSPHISLFKEAPTIFFPALWFEEKATIPDEFTYKLSYSKWLPISGYVCTGILILIGISILMCTFLCKCCKRTRNGEHSIKGRYGKREPKPASNIPTNNAEAETSTNERY